MRDPLIWSGMPNQFAQDAPFLIALFPNHVEIRPYYAPGKGSEAVQKVDIGKARIICEASDRGVVYIASVTSVWALRKAQASQLIDKLVSAKQFELAENIAVSNTTDSDNLPGLLAQSASITDSKVRGCNRVVLWGCLI